MEKPNDNSGGMETIEAAAIEQEYISAERAWTLAKQRTRSYENSHPRLKPYAFLNGKLAFLIRRDALEHDPELRQLKTLELEAYQRRSQLIARRADLLTKGRNS